MCRPLNDDVDGFFAVSSIWYWLGATGFLFGVSFRRLYFGFFASSRFPELLVDIFWTAIEFLLVAVVWAALFFLHKWLKWVANILMALIAVVVCLMAAWSTVMNAEILWNSIKALF